MKLLAFLSVNLFLTFTCFSQTNFLNDNPINSNRNNKVCVSGIYPELAFYNNEGECGTGAVVPWAGRLWVITYGPHSPFGSSDKLYEITSDLQEIVRDESIGGTHANRMIHRESNQLFIGAYIIDSERNVRVIDSKDMPGRLTGNARHLFDPENKLYYATMEEGFYEVDVHSLEVNTLHPDGNLQRKQGEAAQTARLLEGVHGKGLYSGQGVMVYSNNGEAATENLRDFNMESGILAEWDGSGWKTIRRNQFTEVTGPGGIWGNPDSKNDPIWAVGWDYKSLILGSRDNGKWSFYRLPKASHSYDGLTGWNTEWPRIRDIGKSGDPYYLMTMHGMFWHFPETFNSKNTAGIRPLSAYLKVVGDFARWNGLLVLGCDDSANMEFLNKRKLKGEIAGPGQSNSNLWFIPPEKTSQLGPGTADGAVWIQERIESNKYSDPFLFAGWDKRIAWIENKGTETAVFRFEIDKKGNNVFKLLKEISVKPGECAEVEFQNNERGEWIRVSIDKEILATVIFNYTAKDERNTSPGEEFKGMAVANDKKGTGGLLWALGNNKRRLGILSGEISNSEFTEIGYYELDSLLQLQKINNPKNAEFIKKNLAIPENNIVFDEASVIIIDEQGRRWRLPRANTNLDDVAVNGLQRICREVVTERDILNCAGTFYELPANNADGYAKMRPISSHNFRIHDYASYRGMLVMTGIRDNPDLQNKHIIRSADGKASVWVGVIDDLWKLGKPIGTGGPWKNTRVIPNISSDPYLIGFYDMKELMLSHEALIPVTFKIEVDPIGDGNWMSYKEITVQPGEKLSYLFPDTFQARWIRFISNNECIATAWLTYQ